MTPASLAFGSVTTGTTSASQIVTVTNTGASALTVTGATLGGTNPTQFIRTEHLRDGRTGRLLHHQRCVRSDHCRSEGSHAEHRPQRGGNALRSSR